MGGRLERLRRIPEGGPEKVRVFPLRDETKAALGEAKGLEGLPGLRLALIGDRLLVAGSAAMVDAAERLLVALDPTLLPPRVTVQVKVYLGSAEPANVPPPAEDPLLPRLREQFGFEHLTLLAAPVCQGVEGAPLTVQMEGTQAEEEEVRMKLEISALPQVWGPDQVSLSLKMRGHLEGILPRTVADYTLETTLRGAPGETLLLAVPDTVTRSALIYAVTVSMNGEMVVAPEGAK
jgi:hypothetical protein